MNKAALFYATAPDEAVAARIAEALVAEKLAACVNILPGMTSVYVWKGEIEKSAETVMILKSTKAKASNLIARFIALHPYETPAIVSLDISEENSSAAFIDWIASTIAP